MYIVNNLIIDIVMYKYNDVNTISIWDIMRLKQFK
jgi:hypothetical protein